MRQVPFGPTGEMVSEMALGTMMFGDRCDERESREIMAAALDAGVNLIDTAALYADGRTEEIVGRFLKGRRDDVFLVSKVRIDLWDVVECLDGILRRLDTEHLDFYLIHAPARGMDTYEIMGKLDQVVHAGKVRHVGCSNYPAWLYARANRIAAQEGWPPFVCNQIPYNLIERGADVEVLPQAVQDNVAIMAYRPLCLGLLAGRYRPGEALPGDSRAPEDPRIARWLEALSSEINGFLAMAEELDVHPATLAITWLRSHPAITTPVVGVSSLRQLESNLRAFEFDLTGEQVERLTTLFATAEVSEISGGLFKEVRRDLALIER